jgi:hypothetical protein
MHVGGAGASLQRVHGSQCNGLSMGLGLYFLHSRGTFDANLFRDDIDRIACLHALSCACAAVE